MLPLNISRTSTGVTIDGPVVLETQGTESPSSIVSDVSVDGSVLRYNEKGQELEVALAADSGFTIRPDATTLTYTADDNTVNVIRRVNDNDGVWASSIRASAPAGSLEQLALGGSRMASGPIDSTGEELWAALDVESEQLRELVYSSQAGIYVRSSSAWFRLPDDDDSLDGLESIDVNGDIVRAFDAAEENDQPMGRDDVLEYEVEADPADLDLGTTEAEEVPADEEPVVEE